MVHPPENVCFAQIQCFSARIKSCWRKLSSPGQSGTDFIAFLLDLHGCQIAEGNLAGWSAKKVVRAALINIAFG